MQAFLGIWLLSALIAGGIALECEVCSDIGHNCTGNIETCPPGHDFCAITAFESAQDNLRVNGVVKNCVPASACESGSTRINLGKKGSSRSSVSCCKDNACNTALRINLPPLDTKRNGLQCPACYGLLSDSCDDDIVNCAGSESHCLDLTGLIHFGEFSEGVVMKGCTSESVCDADTAEAATFPGSSSTITKLECTPASPRMHAYSLQGTASKSLGSTPLFLLAILGLLMAKF
ncbi:phospholipase A2 inhibitor and Ly6/PLAUR domain-containing protein-like [Tiliqua scincoides]|uniref:phospholipase A2 inhibitor and Ly6/PLAUR domain-containing protein-like n=1 Tax=Tiliqua scincoides TaxID=71010 RepID=UPI0034632067